MVKCSDAEFVAFQQRKTSKRVPHEAKTTSSAEVSGDGETPSVVPEAEPPISEAPREASTAKEPMGAPEEAEADRAGAAKMVQLTGAVSEPEIVEAMGGNEGAQHEARGKRPIKESSRGKGPTRKKRLASRP